MSFYSALRHAPSDDILHTALNLRSFAALGQIRDVGLPAVFVSADDITDTLILPQTGLPLSGRSARVGIRIGERRTDLRGR